MASVSDIVGELEAVRSGLEAAKQKVEDAGSKAEEMITHTEGMELTAAAEALRALHSMLADFTEKVDNLNGELDGLLTAAGAIGEAGS
jgi:hypothetical protein